LNKLLVFTSIVLLLVVCPTSETTFAQTGDNPLIITTGGDHWVWNENSLNLEQLTKSGYASTAVISPQETTIAYRVLSETYLQRHNSSGSGGGDGDRPTDMWLLEIKSGQAQRISQQPEVEIQRSDPTWSPNGDFVAWTELLYDTQVHQVMIYSPQQGTTTSFVLPLAMENVPFPTALQIEWGAPGLAIMHTLDMSVGATIYIYSADGEPLFSTEPMPLSYPWFTWVEDGNEEYIGTIDIQTSDTTTIGNLLIWTLIDPQTGQIYVPDGVPELYSKSAPDGISIYSVTTEEEGTVWHVAKQGTSIGTLEDMLYPAFFINQLAISPNGTQVAYRTQMGVMITDGRTQQGVAIEDDNQRPLLTWGATGWRIRRVN
jgi:hypothetical protein